MWTWTVIRHALSFAKWKGGTNIQACHWGTAHARQEERKRCSAAGMDDCLSKHLRLDGLEHMLATWLKHGSAPSTSSLHSSGLGSLESMIKISGDGFSELLGLFEQDMPRRIRLQSMP